MSKLVFMSNEAPTLGVELELGLVNDRDFALTNAIGQLLDRLPKDDDRCFKPELKQSCIEINTGICRTVDEAEADLRAKLAIVEQAADPLGLQLWWGGTHPFSHWQDSKVTPDERYIGLINSLQDMARQLMNFGLHVHVGVDSGDKAVMICDRIMQHLPTLLALSCSSPFWEARKTGLQSFRSKLMEGLPTAGLPTLMRNWSEYVWLIKHMVDTGFINTIREIWWDVRPHHNFGTVEVRMCDMPGDLNDAMALSALMQCLVVRLSEDIDQGAYQHDCHPMMVRQNKWRAARFGLRAQLVDSYTYELRSVPSLIENLVARLRPVAEEQGCWPHLERVLDMIARPSWADRQIAILDETGDRAEVVRRLTASARITPVPPAAADRDPAAAAN